MDGDKAKKNFKGEGGMEKERFRLERFEGGERMKPAEPEARCAPVGVILLARVPTHPSTAPRVQR